MIHADNNCGQRAIVRPVPQWRVRQFAGDDSHYVVDAEGDLVAVIPARHQATADWIAAAPRRIAELEAALRLMMPLPDADAITAAAAVLRG